eukprot:3387185-Prymnesium_polylepis.1
MSCAPGQRTALRLPSCKTTGIRDPDFFCGYGGPSDSGHHAAFLLPTGGRGVALAGPKVRRVARRVCRGQAHVHRGHRHGFMVELVGAGCAHLLSGPLARSAAEDDERAP